MSGQHIVILTGGALPGQDHQEPSRTDIEAALHRAGVVGIAPENAMGRRIADAAFRLGYHSGAREHRVVAAWIISDEEDARRFAEFVTREIDPAYVTHALSPLKEVLNAADEARQRAVKDEVPF